MYSIPQAGILPQVREDGFCCRQGSLGLSSNVLSLRLGHLAISEVVRDAIIRINEIREMKCTS